MPFPSLFYFIPPCRAGRIRRRPARLPAFPQAPELLFHGLQIRAAQQGQDVRRPFGFPIPPPDLEQPIGKQKALFAGGTAWGSDGAQPAIFSPSDSNAERRAEKQDPPNGAYPL